VNESLTIAVAAGLLASFAMAGLTFVLTTLRLPVSHRVAILGFPQAGKTTLITAVFDYLFRHGAKGRSVVPRGEETIRRVNENLQQLELGRPIRPTKDQDVFAYRAELITRGSGLARRYKLEIGDFPGEDTVAYAEQYGDWLHETPYFQWAASADAFIFVVDAGSIVGETASTQIARQKSALRAAWQRLREEHLSSPGGIVNKPLLLVFTKADLLMRQPESSELLQLGRQGLAASRQVTTAEVDKCVGSVRAQFRDLIEYLERDSSKFGVIFTSVFLRDDDERLGITEIANRLLPRPSLLPRPTRH